MLEPSLKYTAWVVHSDYLRLQSNLDLAPGELFLCVFTQLRPKFWKNSFAWMHQDHSNPVLGKLSIETNGFTKKIVDTSDCLCAGKAASSNDDSQ